MNFMNTINNIINTINQPSVEPYTIQKINNKTGELEEVSIIPVTSGPYTSSMNQYY